MVILAAAYAGFEMTSNTSPETVSESAVVKLHAAITCYFRSLEIICDNMRPMLSQE